MTVVKFGVHVVVGDKHGQEAQPYVELAQPAQQNPVQTEEGSNGNEATQQAEERRKACEEPREHFKKIQERLDTCDPKGIGEFITDWCPSYAKEMGPGIAQAFKLLHEGQYHSVTYRVQAYRKPDGSLDAPKIFAQCVKLRLSGCTPEPADTSLTLLPLIIQCVMDWRPSGPRIYTHGNPDGSITLTLFAGNYTVNRQMIVGYCRDYFGSEKDVNLVLLAPPPPVAALFHPTLRLSGCYDIQELTEQLHTLTK
eukprot:GHVQ01035737.1.p1 GENE.GHVQ01035737.1~~GHVQ01035737.1.p1  ORF type:complete len:282 (-),score=17.80 GHVQ01035737.1:220-978(-)